MLLRMVPLPRCAEEDGEIVSQRILTRANGGVGTVRRTVEGAQTPTAWPRLARPPRAHLAVRCVGVENAKTPPPFR